MSQYRRRKRSGRGSDVRHEVLDVLWSSGKSSVWDVVGELRNKLGLRLHYNTAAGIMNKLCLLGLVRRARVRGDKSYLYTVRASRKQLEKATITGAIKTLFARDLDPRLVLSAIVDEIAETDCRLLNVLEGAVERERQRLRRRF